MRPIKGPNGFAPYRPWTPERRVAASMAAKSRRKRKEVSGVMRSWIWDHARAADRALIGVAPADFTLGFEGSLMNSSSDRFLSISCTIHNDYEAEAVREIIAIMACTHLSAHREMVRGDIYPTEPKPSFQVELATMFGDFQLATKEDTTQ